MKPQEKEGGYISKIRVFDSFRVCNVEASRRRISGDIVIQHMDGKEEAFRLIYSYTEDIQADLNTAGLILTMPVINYTYFSGRLILDFPVSDADMDLISSFLKVNAREVFINKICRRRYEFFKREFLPDEKDINSHNADGNTEITRTEFFRDGPRNQEIPDVSLILSSGGKESLLTQGMLDELGYETYPLFFNESGGHWRTAKTSYEHFASSFSNTSKIWSNVDRFYQFMTSRLPVLEQSVVKKRADTYPVRLFIFPVYVFASIPLLRKHNIGNILMGNEFDNPKDMPAFNGLKHYYGVFDQSNDFSAMMTEYFGRKGIASRLWSAVYPVSGIMVEEILVRRYHSLFLQQRSCHSCRIEDGRIVPCGKCTKCLGVMMFILAAGGDPGEVMYTEASIGAIRQNVESSRMRLDPDELSYLKARLWTGSAGTDTHVRSIHRLPDEPGMMSRIPENFRPGIESIYREYCSGITALDSGEWRAVS